MAKRRILIIGAGGHGKSVAEAARLSEAFEIAGFLDDGLSEGCSVLGSVVLGPVAATQALARHFDCAVVALGKNSLREQITLKLNAEGTQTVSVIHPRAFVSPTANILPGSTIMAGAMIGAEAELGLATIVNSGAVVDHHAQIHDYGHIGVNACMAGGTILGRGAFMQAGSALGYGAIVPPKTILKPGQAFER